MYKPDSHENVHYLLAILKENLLVVICRKLFCDRLSCDLVAQVGM